MTLIDIKVLVKLVAFVVHCEALSPGLRCTETGSHILAMSIPVPLIRQGYNMASTMPDPNVNLQLQGSHCGFVAFRSCRRTASS